ncbi:competence/damage-inducible protein A [Ravibacter arvi]|uniref:CinA-like protein n=1 Tax=Ravibacter arvi TaxID=2051041 RepID=A0ABP8M3W1_9BACT
MSTTVSAEIITIGDEILFGHILDTNTQWIGLELTDIGILPAKKTSVGDRYDEILEAFRRAFDRYDVVIVTGGLGPTKDDITKQVLCDFFETELEIHEEALEHVTAFFSKRGREMIESNRLQAALPKKCKYLVNHWGTAPGMWFEKDGKVLVSLPGVPYEMKELMKHSVLPALEAHFSLPVIVHHTIRTIGIGESFLAEKIADWENALPKHVKLAYLPSFSGVKLRLTGYGSDRVALTEELLKYGEGLNMLAGIYIYAQNELEIEEKVGQLLAEKGATLATAESCTGGYIAHRITGIPGSSTYFLGGVVSYANEVKEAVLDVPSEYLKTYGAVSEQVAEAMAEGVRTRLGATFAISTTGIAGPGGGTEEKPVGTIWIACAGPQGTVSRKLQLGTLRDVNIQLTAMHVLNMLRQSLELD